MAGQDNTTMVDRWESFFALRKGRKWTRQEKLGIVAAPVALILLAVLIALFTPELRPTPPFDKTSRAPGRGSDNPTTNNSSQGAYEMTDGQQTLFRIQLATQTSFRDTLRIGCTSSSESSCAAAGRFLSLLSQAGWQIEGNRVFRLQPQTPMAGVALVTQTSEADASNPLPAHERRWRTMDLSARTLYWAFQSLNIPTNTSTDGSLKSGTLGVYFGPEPK